MLKPIALFSLLVFASQLQAAKIYKWVDENGQIHYSSQKPPGQEVETVKVRKGPKVTAPEAAEPDPVDPNEPVDPQANAETDAEAEAEARAQLARTDAANRQRLCEQARQNLAALNNSVRVQRIDEKTGEAVRMTDDQRVSALARANQAIREYCN